jgi:hypothetical protein
MSMVLTSNRLHRPKACYGISFPPHDDFRTVTEGRIIRRFLARASRRYGKPTQLSLPGLTGQSSSPCAIGVSKTLPHRKSGGYWIARSSRAMTVCGVKAGHDSAWGEAGR